MGQNFSLSGILCGSHPPVQIANIVVQIAVVPCRAWIFQNWQVGTAGCKECICANHGTNKGICACLCASACQGYFFSRLCKERSDFALSVDVGVN